MAEDLHTLIIENLEVSKRERESTKTLRKREEQLREKLISKDPEMTLIKHSLIETQDKGAFLKKDQAMLT